MQGWRGHWEGTGRQGLESDRADWNGFYADDVQVDPFASAAVFGRALCVLGA